NSYLIIILHKLSKYLCANDQYRSTQTIALIKQRLYYAMKNNYEVTIQLNELDSELKPIEVSGQIEFLNDDEFRLAQKNEMLLENIRNVTFSIE
ncbi:hypothetical protein, partial [Fructilactobacillus sanfranciscensis]|uniref:hypothetical protein n=3 Tax=Fructilactobacillus sanfranciscensis TaxID=1625 RepID=UPI001EE22757